MPLSAKSSRKSAKARITSVQHKTNQDGLPPLKATDGWHRPSVRFLFVSYRTNLASLFSVLWCSECRTRMNIRKFGLVDIGIGQVMVSLVLGLVPLLVAVENE